MHDPFPVDESRNADPDADEFGSEPGDKVGEIRRHVFQPLKHRCARVDRRAFELRENRAGLVHSGAENLGPADVESERERHGDETYLYLSFHRELGLLVGNLTRFRGRSSMAEFQPSKLAMRVRFPSPAHVSPMS